MRHAVSLLAWFATFTDNSHSLALSLMHARKWVHRDISTGNILLDSDGVGRLSDFEYAKSMDDAEELRIVCVCLDWRTSRLTLHAVDREPLNSCLLKWNAKRTCACVRPLHMYRQWKQCLLRPERPSLEL